MDRIDELNTSFEDLLIKSDAEDPVNDDDADPVQAVVAPDDYDSDDNSDDNEEQPYSEGKKETWSEDASTHDRYPFSEEYEPHADIQDCEGSVDYFELFFNDKLSNLIVTEMNKSRRSYWSYCLGAHEGLHGSRTRPLNR